MRPPPPGPELPIQTGAAAEEVESDINDKIEGAVNTISAVDNSSKGVSLVAVQFVMVKWLGLVQATPAASKTAAGA